MFEKLVLSRDIPILERFEKIIDFYHNTCESISSVNFSFDDASDIHKKSYIDENFNIHIICNIDVLIAGVKEDIFVSMCLDIFRQAYLIMLLLNKSESKHMLHELYSYISCQGNKMVYRNECYAFPHAVAAERYAILMTDDVLLHSFSSDNMEPLLINYVNFHLFSNKTYFLQDEQAIWNIKSVIKKLDKTYKMSLSKLKQYELYWDDDIYKILIFNNDIYKGFSQAKDAKEQCYFAAILVLNYNLNLRYMIKQFPDFNCDVNIIIAKNDTSISGDI